MSEKMLIKQGNIHNAIEKEAFVADILIEKGKIAKIAERITGPGSSNVIGGTFCAIKTYGHRIDDMIVKEKVGMKIAFGENPKNCYKDKGVCSRMRQITADFLLMMPKWRRFFR